jgi:hypothetical protein
VLTETGLDRNSGGAETFNFQNSGAGAMTLQVDGVEVVTLSGSQTLTSKTLTSPNVNTPTLVLANAAGAAPTTDGEIKFDRTGETLEVGDGAATKIFSHDTGTATLVNKSLTAPTLTGTVLVSDEIAHTGDTNNKWVVGTDTQDFQTGGSSRLDISNSGVRLGGAGARITTVIDDDTMATAAATNIPTAESVKAYVDTAAAEPGHLAVGDYVWARLTTSNTAIALGDEVDGASLASTGVGIPTSGNGNIYYSGAGTTLTGGQTWKAKGSHDAISSRYSATLWKRIS